MKRKTAVIYITIIVLLAALTIVSGYYAKGDWLKGQLSELYPVAGDVVTQHPVSIKFRSPVNPAIQTNTDPDDKENSIPCETSPDSTDAAIYCLRAYPKKWDPSKEIITFTFTLKNSNGKSIIISKIRDQAGKLLYTFPPRSNTENDVFYIDLWQGLDDDGNLVPHGKYYYNVYGEEQGDEHVLSTSVDFEVI